MKECSNCYLCFDDDIYICPHDNTPLFTSHKSKTTLGNRYVLERRLGKGGMGAVYKAKHKFLRSLHAIKIISPELVIEDESLLVRFRQEAILSASIHHPNVVAVTDFGIEHENTPYLVMEYIDGMGLDEFLKRENKLNPMQAYKILKPIALGVAEAHKKGIIHRDLKPLNVMLSYDKTRTHFLEVKVLDFGLAKIKSTESFASLVQAKTTNLLGSPHFMSPEQWSNEGVDTRSDIYSLGVILFQMLAGDVPFKGNSIPAIMYQHLQNPVPSLAALGVTVSPQIEAVLHKALAKEQDERFSTIEEFLFKYEDALLNTSGRIINTNENFDRLPDLPQPTVKIGPLSESGKYSGKNFSKTYNLTYLNSAQNQTLANFFNQSNRVESEEKVKLEQQFLEAQTQLEEARNKVSEAEKLASELNEAQQAAEDAHRKVLQAQQKLEQDMRQRLQAEMEQKLAAEKKAREKAEAEARLLGDEVKARKAAEERANQMAKKALEAQQRAEEERLKAEKEIHQRQQEAGTRRKAEAAVLELAKEVDEAKKRYEEAKSKADREAYFRLEAEVRHQKIEEEILRIAKYEAEQRKLVEEQSARQIKEQVIRLQEQASEAEKKAFEARLLAESESKKREAAESARIKAELDARRLAEEIIEAQKQLEEAQQLAKLEAEKRAVEETARKKAEESARSTSLKNEQNVESIKKDLMLQIEEARSLAKSEAEKRALEETARKKAEESIRTLRATQENGRSQGVSLLTQKINAASFDSSSLESIEKETLSRDRFSSGKILIDTTPTSVSNTHQIPASRKWTFLYVSFGLLTFGILGGLLGIFFINSLTPPITSTENVVNNKINENTGIQPALPERVAKQMVFIKGGSFLMGRDDVDKKDPIFGNQHPAKETSVSSFYIDRTEVSNGEYAVFVGESGYKPPAGWRGSQPPSGQENLPVTNVSKVDADKFADWVSRQVGFVCHLPSESEWEYAARGGSYQNLFPWGNEWTEGRANIDSGKILEVGKSSDQTEVYGIRDLMGNVMEWTSTNYNLIEDKYTVRGASYMATPKQIENKHLLLTFRQGIEADKKYSLLGFRLVCKP